MRNKVKALVGNLMYDDENLSFKLLRNSYACQTIGIS